MYVEGRLKTRKWTDKDGAEKYTTEIIAQEMTMLGGREDGAGPRGGGGGEEGATASRSRAERHRAELRRRRALRHLRRGRRRPSRVRSLMTWMTIFRSKPPRLRTADVLRS